MTEVYGRSVDKFQSTPPRGRRRNQKHPLHLYCIISIHASAREATYYSCSHNLKYGFQSTPPRGRRPVTEVYGRSVDKFQSTPPRGRRLRRDIPLDRVCIIFQSTPPRGRRLRDAVHKPHKNGFQSTPPRGRRLH